MHVSEYDPTLDITFWTGAQALTWCRMNESRWRSLQDRCGDDNPYLAPAFVTAWYAHYQDLWTPVLAVGRCPEGELVALMPLAGGDADRLLTAAGANQSEYQGWLCAPEWNGVFLAGLARRLDEAYPGYTLSLHHIRAREQVAALRTSPFGPRLDVSVQRKPVLELDIDRLAASEKKSGNRSKLKRLQAGGAIEPVRARDADRLRQIIDPIANDYDFRQGAVNASTPFASDPRKRPFHLDWMHAAPQELYVIALRQDERIIAGLIGTVVGQEVAVGIHSHAPELAEYSPGKFLLHQAARDLSATQVRRIDLTPGGEAWKDRMATSAEPVWSVRIHPSTRARRRTQVLATARASAKRLGMREPAIAAARFASRLRRGSWKGRLRRHTVADHRELRVYRCSLAGRSPPPGDAAVHVNSTRDLVRLGQALEDAGLQARSHFLADAAQRLGQGHSVYTRCEAAIPAHYCWVAPPQSESYFREFDYRLRYPESGPVCYEAFTLPHARGRGFATQTIAHALHDLVHRHGATAAYIPVPGGDRLSEWPVVNNGGALWVTLIRRKLLTWSPVEAIYGAGQSAAGPETAPGSCASEVPSGR